MFAVGEAIKQIQETYIKVYIEPETLFGVWQRLFTIKTDIRDYINNIKNQSFILL